MPGIDPEVIFHKLSIRADAKLVKQKSGRMNKERSRAISNEVDPLLQATSFDEHSTSTGSPIRPCKEKEREVESLYWLYESRQSLPKERLSPPEDF